MHAISRAYSLLQIFALRYNWLICGYPIGIGQIDNLGFGFDSTPAPPLKMLGKVSPTQHR